MEKLFISDTNLVPLHLRLFARNSTRVCSNDELKRVKTEALILCTWMCVPHVWIAIWVVQFFQQRKPLDYLQTSSGCLPASITADHQERSFAIISHAKIIFLQMLGIRVVNFFPLKNQTMQGKQSIPLDAKQMFGSVWWRRNCSRKTWTRWAWSLEVTFMNRLNERLPPKSNMKEDFWSLNYDAAIKIS